MSSILSHPFRLDTRGYIATVEQTSDAGVAEQLAILALTHTGERALVPGYGIPDPVFAGFDTDVYVGAVAAWGPPATISKIDVRPIDDVTQQVAVSFA